MYLKTTTRPVNKAIIKRLLKQRINCVNYIGIRNSSNNLSTCTTSITPIITTNLFTPSFKLNSFTSPSYPHTVIRNMSTSRTPPIKPLVWEITPQEITKRRDDILKKSTQIDDEIANEKNPTFENVILKYALNENDLINESSILGFYHHVSTDKELRDASVETEEKIENYMIEAGTREDVYKSIKKVYDDLPNLKNSLDAESIRLIEKLETKFRRNGLNLDKETRDKVSELRKELSSITIKFSKQLGEESGFILFTKDELKGLSDSILDQFEYQQDSGKYKVTFKYPDYIPLMKYAQNEETRRKAYLGFENRAIINKDLVKDAIILRAKIAKLLGYKNHSEFVLEERMAKSPEIVGPFLNDLREKATKKGHEEISKLLALKNEHRKELGLTGASHEKLYSWDHSFYNNLQIERDYQVDDQKISEYFPINETISAMLNIFSTLFNLEFVSTKVDSQYKWHEDVHLFAVWRSDTNEMIGYLYLDLHPRDNKYGHAANFSLSKRFHHPDGTIHYPSTAIVCNFSKPSSSKPSLLKHSEVTTFFHELGHGLHDLIGDAKYARFSGTSVDWDFVEAPSQMLEFWTWNRDQLKQLSGHYTDASKKLDDDLIDSLIRTKHVNGAIATLRQLYFGLFDLTLHTSPDGEVDVAERWNTLKEEITGISQGGEYTHGYSSFGHIMGGYDSGYYGYMWSEVFACDMYYTKFKSNPMDPKVGGEYRDKVIGLGGSKDQTLLLKDFLGREPNNAAFLEELGIASA